MATTPVYNWVMPDPADLVKDLPADFELFGDAVDATVDGIDDRLAVVEAVPPMVVPAISTYYTRPYANFGLASTGTVTEDVTYYTPIFLPNCTLDRISLRTGATVPVGSNTTRLGIYRNGATNRPDTLLLDAGTVNPNAASTNFEITINQAITRGLYWLAFNRQASGGTPPNFSRIESGLGVGIGGNSSLFTGQTPVGFNETGITGGFATAGTLGLEANFAPVVWVRIA